MKVDLMIKMFYLICLVPALIVGQLTCQVGTQASEGFPGGELLRFQEIPCPGYSARCARAELTINFLRKTYLFSTAQCTTKALCFTVCNRTRTTIESQFSNLGRSVDVPSITACNEACCPTTNCNQVTIDQMPSQNYTIEFMGGKAVNLHSRVWMTTFAAISTFTMLLL